MPVTAKLWEKTRADSVPLLAFSPEDRSMIHMGEASYSLKSRLR
jgi:hypothetical protein